MREYMLDYVICHILNALDTYIECTKYVINHANIYDRLATFN